MCEKISGFLSSSALEAVVGVGAAQDIVICILRFPL